MAVSDIIPFGQRPELHTLVLTCSRCRDTGPRVELKVLESEKDSFKGIWPGTWLTRSWPITQGLPLALKLTEGTVSTDLLVAYTPFFSLFLDPTYMGQGSGAQGTSRGFNQLKKGHEAVRVTLPFRDF